MINFVVLTGRLVADPEHKITTKGTALTNFVIAVDKRRKKDADGEKETNFIRCVAFAHTGEFIAKYARKGMLVVVEGVLDQQVYEKNGENRSILKVIVNEIGLPDRPKGESNQTPQEITDTDERAEEYRESFEDDGLPF